MSMIVCRCCATRHNSQAGGEAERQAGDVRAAAAAAAQEKRAPWWGKQALCSAR